MKRDVGVAYILLLIAGLFGAHRYYTGKQTSAIWMTALMLLGVGFVINPFWVIVDLFFTARYTDEYNQRV